MSLIASFWTLDRSFRSTIVSAFEPTTRPVGTRRLFGILPQRSETHYPWFDYLSTHAGEEATYSGSGSDMVGFDLVFASRYKSIFERGLPESEQLSECCGASAVLLESKDAALLEKDILAMSLTKEEVMLFYDANGNPDERGSRPESVVAAGVHLSAWCAAVGQSSIALLIIG